MGKRVDIPEQFLNVRYNVSHYPGAPGVMGLVGGANCQHFAYEILRYFGEQIPNFRSSNLWEDTQYTAEVSDLAPLDIVLFNRTDIAWGAHVGLCISCNEVIHLCKKLARPAVWGIQDFKNWPEYKTFIGAKRLLQSKQ